MFIVVDSCESDLVGYRYVDFLLAGLWWILVWLRSVVHVRIVVRADSWESYFVGVIFGGRTVCGFFSCRIMVKIGRS